MQKFLSLLGAAGVLLALPAFAQSVPQKAGVSAPAAGSADPQVVTRIARNDPPTAPVARTSSPQAFLEGVFKPYLAADYKGQAYWEADRFFAPDLAAAMEHDRQAAEKSGKQARLKADPFVNPVEMPKDWQISNLVVVAMAGANGGATGQVMFVNQNKPSHLTVLLVNSPAGWRIAEIRGSGPSLRALYGLN
jgi:hypothetical protein